MQATDADDDRLSGWQIGGDGTFVIDQNGVVSIAAGKTLDFEGTASYR